MDPDVVRKIGAQDSTLKKTFGKTYISLIQFQYMFFSVVCWYMYMSDNILFIKVLLILKTSVKEFVMKNLLIINWVNTRYTVLEEGLIKRWVSQSRVILSL